MKMVSIGFQAATMPCGIKSTEDELRKWINEQPTAYDVDKVVEQLENNVEKSKGMSYKFFHTSLRDKYKSEAGAYIKTIKIVKAGGVDNG